MKDFEKKIIRACKENDVQTISYEIWMVLSLLTMCGFFLKLPITICGLIVILMLTSIIFGKAAEKIQLTEEEIFLKNNFFLVIFSDGSIWNYICWLLLLVFWSILFGVINVVTGVWIIDFLLTVGSFLIGHYISDQIAKFFKNRLK